MYVDDYGFQKRTVQYSVTVLIDGCEPSDTDAWN